MIYFSEQEQRHIVDVRQRLEHAETGVRRAEGSVRIGLLLGYLIMLALEGWLLTKVLLF
ncbi:MAG: hypothetical protein MUP44_07615 [Anaerolineales bacterium]|nr:hypothetical protein [Anaerolineales bacterium]